LKDALTTSSENLKALVTFILLFGVRQVRWNYEQKRDRRDDHSSLQSSNIRGRFWIWKFRLTVWS